MENDIVLQNTIEFVKLQLQNAESGHDWFHIERVYKNALLISKTEKCNLFVVALGALLHDIADSKFHQGDETMGPKIAQAFLKTQAVSDEIIDQVKQIIENISFKGGHFKTNILSIELQIVQEDRKSVV